MPSPEDIVKALRKLANTRVLIGIPEGTPSRSDPGVTNASLAYIHEFGSPANNIPARPFLVPGTENSRDKWEPYLRQAGEAAFAGNEGRSLRALDAAGQVAVSAVKGTISAGIPPPIKPETVAARYRRLSGGGGIKGQRAVGAYRQFYKDYKAGMAAMTASTETPLIDTAQLINSITFVVRR